MHDIYHVEDCFADIKTFWSPAMQNSSLIMEEGQLLLIVVYIK